MSLRSQFFREVRAAGLPAKPGPGETVSESELAELPEPARRYLRFMRVLGQPRDWSFRLGLAGRFRTKPSRAWMPCEAWQYNSRPALARIFHISIRIGGLLPVMARDTYVNGRGRMLVKLLDLFPIADGKGAEYDIGELVTYLNDAVMMAPSMLLAPEVSWSAVDASSFDVSLAGGACTVTGRVFLDEQGAPKDFSTTDRFCSDPGQSKRLLRARWTTPIAGWQCIDGRPLPTGGQAVWHLAGGPFAYADFRIVPDTLAFNVAPGE